VFVRIHIGFYFYNEHTHSHISHAMFDFPVERIGDFNLVMGDN